MSEESLRESLDRALSELEIAVLKWLDSEGTKDYDFLGQVAERVEILGCLVFRRLLEEKRGWAYAMSDVVSVSTNKPILDPCCGGRMFYFDKDNPNVLYCDNREFSEVLCDGRPFDVKPDMLCDVTALPFADESFWHVVFDPPPGM